MYKVVSNVALLTHLLTRLTLVPFVYAGGIETLDCRIIKAALV